MMIAETADPPSSPVQGIDTDSDDSDMEVGVDKSSVDLL